MAKDTGLKAILSDMTYEGLLAYADESGESPEQCVERMVREGLKKWLGYKIVLHCGSLSYTEGHFVTTESFLMALTYYERAYKRGTPLARYGHAVLSGYEAYHGEAEILRRGRGSLPQEDPFTW